MDTYTTLLNAANDVLEELRLYADRAINPYAIRGYKLEYNVSSVSLIVFPNQLLRWGAFGAVLQGITEFVERWGPMEIIFDIFDDTTGPRVRMGVGTMFRVQTVEGGTRNQ